MSFVRVKDLLEMGKKNNACVLAFDAADGNMIKSVIKGAEAAGKPVMVMLYPGMRNIMPFGVFAETTKYYAEREMFFTVDSSMPTVRAGNWNTVQSLQAPSPISTVPALEEEWAYRIGRW